MGLFDGAFGGGGQGILPDWLFNPQLMQNNPNAMAGIQPAGSFADMWSGVPQGIQNGTLDPQGANNNASYGMPQIAGVPLPQAQPAMQPSFNPFNAGDEGGMPPAAQPTMGQAQGGAMPSALGGLPVPDGPSSLNMPSGNPLAGLIGPKAGLGNFGGGGWDPLDIAGPGGLVEGPAKWINNNRTGLALFGAGIAGGGGKGNWNAGLSDALRGMAMGGQIDQKQQSEIQSQNAAYQAVKAAGGTEAQALAARSNPEVFKAIAPELFSGWKLVKTGSNPITGDQFMMQGPGGQLRPLDSFVKGGGEGSIGGGQLGGPGMLAKGVKQYDPTLVGEPYMEQFGPEVQAAAKAWMRGDVMPAGNPRLQGIANAGKIVAQTYAAGIGQPHLASDLAFAEKRKMHTDLASSGNSSMGGILSNGKSAFGHLANLSDNFVDLNNASGPDIPGGAHIATIRNAAGNVLLPTSEIKGKILAVEQNATKYGQESTKFYAGTGGGVEERLGALKSAGAKTSSGVEQAAFLETEKKLMIERLHQKEEQIRQTLGQDYLDRHPVIDEPTKRSLAKIDANIAKLRGQVAPEKNAASSSGVVKWEVGPNGVPRPVSK